MMEKPCSQACENNKAPILEVLLEAFSGCREILEIGSGTGQHAAYMAAHLPWLKWQTSDLRGNHDAIRQWLADAPATALAPIALNVSDDSWPTSGRYDGFFSANTLHIMGWESVVDFFAGLDRSASPPATLCIYGPFNYSGQYTSDSNARFDQWLRQRDPASGIRDFEAVNELAHKAGFKLQADHAMPANNRLLCWRQSPC
jgi:cyclopropane fatty-acyl-phospholipid synthase-like methyltransferase